MKIIILGAGLVGAPMAIDLNRDEEKINLNIKIIPITFDDGKHGVSLIFKSIIDDYNIRQELDKNEKKLRLFFK